MLHDYSINIIINADETALFFKALPEKSLQYSNLKNDCIKVSKEGLSILLCCNWSGTEKFKPIVIGNYANPRCFKNINRANLPVYYRNNLKLGWITIFLKNGYQNLISNSNLKTEKYYYF